tara:strand:- start:2042 stop:2284 length:243 start_codon:yes stop_codon:yes gene_type:complete
MYTIQDRYIHGNSYALLMDNIEFLTWRFNEETKQYWLKLHVPSGKEIRIRVSENELRDIVDTWSMNMMELDIGDEHGLDK